MKIKYKETQILRKRYRIVKCETCGKIFNAFTNGSAEAIFYQCPNSSCQHPGLGKLTPATKEVAADFIHADLEASNPPSYVLKQFQECFPFYGEEPVEV